MGMEPIRGHKKDSPIRLCKRRFNAIALFYNLDIDRVESPFGDVDLMLVRLTGAMGGLAVRLLAAAYLLCVLAPAASFAFGDASRAAHCLTDDHRGLQSKHVHMAAGKMLTYADGTSHIHSDQATDSKHDHGKASTDGQCCGLACFSALPASGFHMVIPILPRGPAELAKIDAVAEHLPPGLFRPPLAPLSV